MLCPQFNVTELAAADKQADLETERLRLKALAAKSVCRVGAREDAAAATAATQAARASSEQVNSFALHFAVGKRRAQEIFGALKFECCSR
jgi:hypothetical protein